MCVCVVLFMYFCVYLYIWVYVYMYVCMYVLGMCVRACVRGTRVRARVRIVKDNILPIMAFIGILICFLNISTRYGLEDPGIESR